MPNFMSSQDMDPADLATLQDLFDNLCQQEHIAHRSAAADEVAKRVMQLYRAGVRDRSVYLAIFRKRKRHTNSDRLTEIYHRGRVN
ncbi:hypothetical protein IB238_16340 [Rhizobium sp. ARZ01]|uniref:hypothetical protein n=1 Tax=Rhizobium sp. ARZ01 TaxID=2769313 RepID=UPI0017827ADF|nr:hypothetical protein [Rhizobium sp. ARZ01]MBD9374193.1 hypothetical protein [Rhizobium sp. ARZ01]